MYNNSANAINKYYLLNITSFVLSTECNFEWYWNNNENLFWHEFFVQTDLSFLPNQIICINCNQLLVVELSNHNVYYRVVLYYVITEWTFTFFLRNVFVLLVSILIGATPHLNLKKLTGGSVVKDIKPSLSSCYYIII